MIVNFGKTAATFFLPVCLLIILGTHTQAQTITTVAGDGYAGYSELSENVPADSTGLYYPVGVAVDAAGNLYIVDQKNNRIRRVSAKTGLIVTIAGNGSYAYGGFSGDGGAATKAELNFPAGVAVDVAGNVYIADQHNQRVRKVAAKTGIITTVAGSRDNGYSGDNGAATDAELNNPAGVAVDATGNLYISDFGNNRIREVDAKTGIITTIAGTGDQSYSGDGGAATAAQLNNPWGIVVDASGTIYFDDYSNNCVRKISGGIISTIAGNENPGFSGDDGPATAATLNSPAGIAIDESGVIYIGDSFNNRVRKISSSGIIRTVAGNGKKNFSGDGGAATSATLNTPKGVAVDPSGDAVYVADYYNNRIRKIGIY